MTHLLLPDARNSPAVAALAVACDDPRTGPAHGRSCSRRTFEGADAHFTQCGSNANCHIRSWSNSIPYCHRTSSHHSGASTHRSANACVDVSPGEANSPRAKFRPGWDNTTRDASAGFDLHFYETRAGESLPQRLSGLLGTPVVLMFWFPGCDPFMTDLQDIGSVYRGLRWGGVRFIGVQTHGCPQEGQEIVDELDLSYDFVFDDHGEASRLYGVVHVPKTVVLKADHTVAGWLKGRTESWWAQGSVGEHAGVFPPDGDSDSHRPRRYDLLRVLRVA